MNQEVLFGFFQGTATENEVGQIYAWLEGDPANRRNLIRERKLFDAMLVLKDPDAMKAELHRRRNLCGSGFPLVKP